MSFTNSYKPPPPVAELSEAELYGPDPYDINFTLPLHLPSLETERVKLQPFIPSIHAKHYWEKASEDPDLFRYYPVAHPTLESYLTYHETKVRADPANTLLIIIDKTKPDPEHPEYDGGSLAGALGLFYTSADHLSSEIAYVVIFPAYQRTHVASNAIGVLMRYCLELPTATPQGLGLRRVQWCAHDKNLASARLAERMGFKREGIIRWRWVLPEVLARDGMKPSENDKYPTRYGRNTLCLSVCWDDWESGVREVVEKNINRRT
ncbi:hypothetical protein EW026_g1992 [Hermanssonia centrifuga]|uniref:N-acetyltransferase domain-containing protein n=1 Tax=Hermanssonia centrifuga TaxID=98765 RepID=A0A4S4KPQ0_9APHY|nr:hypothetical protein EW026_g1992 [Hermanssonia centrifuga]